MGKYDDIAAGIKFDPPIKHHLAGKKVKALTQSGTWEDANIIHVYGDNQYYLVVIRDSAYFMSRRYECVRSHRIRMVD